jgi:hypothetical protein
MALWSKDAGSYAYSAFRWIHAGVWETDPRRGPIYSLLIAFCGKAWGSVDSLMVLQHIMGGVSILLSILVLRLMHGKRALIPLALCGYAYAVYGLPVYLEHLIRNETILFFCGSVSLATWYFAIRWSQPHWLWLTGIAAAILTATKNVWFPFPILFILATVFFLRGNKRAALTQIVIFILAFGVPYSAAKYFKHHTLGIDRSDEPQEGVLWYGRTAQFTKLDGGKYPELKAQIRDEVLAYQHEVFATNPPHLNNNEILKKTVVPTLTKILRAQGQNGEELNRICRDLAKEAILAHPFQYGMQVWRDIVHMNLLSGQRYVAPDNSEPDGQRALLKELRDPDPMIHVPDHIAKLDAIIGSPAGDQTAISPKMARKQATIHSFTSFGHALLTAWMFDLAPVLLTSLLLPVVFFLSPGPQRAWWFGAAGLWYFTVVLLSTIGRPLDRYLIPALPVMFFTLSTAVIFLWNALVSRLSAHRAPASPHFITHNS